MAIGFDTGTIEKVKLDLPSAATMPILISCWVNVDASETDSNATPIFIGDSDDTPRMFVRYRDGQSDLELVYSDGALSNTRDIVTSVTKGSWHHVLAYTDTTDCMTWGDGTNVSDTTNTVGALSDMDKMSLGGWYSSTNSVTRLTGLVEHGVVWTGIPTLTVSQGDAIAAHMALGGNPRLWYPDKIVGYVPGTYNNLPIFGINQSENGTPDELPPSIPLHGAW